MPDWMKGQEHGLENLQMELLDAPQEDSGAEDESSPFASSEFSEPEEPEEDGEDDGDESDEEGSRMIDLPFRLFDD